jgi:DNA-binding NtrC family response regulator
VSALAANDADVVIVLLVEDEIWVRLDIACCLEDAGYVVVEAGTGEAAMALCNSRTSIDMVIADINLGGSASGWDVGEYFHTVRPDVPVVYTSEKSADAGRCGAGSVFVSKPYRHSDILDACQRLARSSLPSRQRSLPRRRAFKWH